MTVFHKTAGNVFSHSSPLMLVKPFYAIDISLWVVQLKIDAQQKDCKAECTLLPLPLSTKDLLTSRVIPRPHRANAHLTRHPTAPKQATQANLRYPPPHLRLLNQHHTESPLQACETATKHSAGTDSAVSACLRSSLITTNMTLACLHTLY